MKAGWRAVVVAAMGLGVFAPSALAVPTLSGEFLTGAPTTSCSSSDDIGWQVSGQAAGPYPGTFTETGNTAADSFQTQAAFTIRSGSTTITGQKRAIFGQTTGGVSCNPAPPPGKAFVNLEQFAYTARWTATKGDALLATRGTYTDAGKSDLTFNGFTNPTTFSETYTSDQSQATVVKCELVVLNLIALPQPLSNCA